MTDETAEPVWLDEEEQCIWRSVLRMHSHLVAAIGQSLREDCAMSLPDFEVLVILSESPEGVLRVRDLRCELQWEKSRLAHHLRRMEERDYLRRETCAEDPRAPLVRITATGMTAIREAAPGQVARVRALFFDALTPSQQRAMRGGAEAVLAHIARDQAAAAESRGAGACAPLDRDSSTT